MNKKKSSRHHGRCKYEEPFWIRYFQSSNNTKRQRCFSRRTVSSFPQLVRLQSDPNLFTAFADGSSGHQPIAPAPTLVFRSDMMCEPAPYNMCNEEPHEDRQEFYRPAESHSFLTDIDGMREKFKKLTTLAERAFASSKSVSPPKK
eukprot:303779_1